MDITHETDGNRRWFVNEKVVSRRKMFDWLREKGLYPSQLTTSLVAEYITWAEAQGWKWEV